MNALSSQVTPRNHRFEDSRQMQQPDPPGKAGLLAGAEIVKYLMALATGAIVFSAGLLNDKVFLPPAAKWFILISWAALAFSTLGGILASMRIPIQLSEQKYDVEDAYLKYPGMIQQLAFLLGIVLLGIALSIILFQQGRAALPAKEQVEGQQPINVMISPPLQPTPSPTVEPLRRQLGKHSRCKKSALVRKRFL